MCRGENTVWLTVTLILGLIITHSNGNVKTCFTLDQCSCRVYDWITDENRILSLQDLDSKLSTKFELKDFDGNKYFYSPCTPAPAKKGNTSLFYMGGSSQRSPVNLATPSSMTTMPGYLFAYRAVDSDGIVRSTLINLVCDETLTTPEFSHVRNTNGDKNTYDFALKSKCACLDGCSYDPNYFKDIQSIPSDETLSTTSIVFITTFTLLGFYFMLGTVFNKYYKHRHGWDAIPHSAALGRCATDLKSSSVSIWHFVSPRRGEKTQLLESRVTQL